MEKILSFVLMKGPILKDIVKINMTSKIFTPRIGSCPSLNSKNLGVLRVGLSV